MLGPYKVKGINLLSRSEFVKEVKVLKAALSLVIWKENQQCIDFSYEVQRFQKGISQLGSVFVLDTKCHGFKSCHPYLLLLSWVITRGINLV